MIMGLAQHGFAEEALFLFGMMSDRKSNDIFPNYVTYLGVLCACSHAGRVDEGYRYFRDMEFVHGINPMMVHYGAMVDVLGRAGRLSEAYRFIQRMPFAPDPIVWRTLLSACTVHDVCDHTGIGDKVRKRLLGMEPKRGGNLVIVANIYAEAGKWEKAASVRRVMRDGGLKKMAGESCVDLGGSLYRFFAGHDSCPDLMPVYDLLDGLNLHLRMVH
jgi:cell division protease FtsH